jgi:putative nucleotidyltransferase with HDIG domain
MKNTGHTAQIEVDALRVGMFVHLDSGWMSHPFPLSSFRITSPQQIATIRALGLQRRRVEPVEVEDRTAPAALAPLVAPVDDPQAHAKTARREALRSQRASLAQCERQFAEAARECRQLTEMVLAQPRVAGEKAQALTQAMVDKLLGEHELCIRLLTEAAGDKASAHGINVTLVSLLLGRSFGLGPSEMLDLGVGAMLHDIGKLELPERVRHRQDHFTAPEVKFYEQHVSLGVAQALRMGLTQGAALVIAQHHEHCDGSGFPLKLGSERMSPMSSIVALVNRYDNLCNPQIPSKALTPHEALSLLFAQGKSKFDAAILGNFIKMMGVYPAGSVVQLTDDRFGIVVGVNSSRPLKPRVMVHEAGVPREEALVLDLEQVAGVGIRRSLRPATLSSDVLDYLAPRQRVAYFVEPVQELAA